MTMLKQADFDALFADNVTGAITPAKLRSFVDQLYVQVKYSVAVNTVNGTGPAHMKTDEGLAALQALTALPGGALITDVCTRLNLLKASLIAHVVSVGSQAVDGVHRAADTATQAALTAIPDATDLTSAITLVGGMSTGLGGAILGHGSVGNGGADGRVFFDGVSTVLGLTPSSGVYTLNRDIMPSTQWVARNVTVATHNFRDIASVAITGQDPVTSKVTGNSPDSTGATPGSAFIGSLGTANVGATGKTNTPSNGANSSTASSNIPIWPTASTAQPGQPGTGNGQGGGGGSAGANTGGTGGQVNPVTNTSGSYTQMAAYTAKCDTAGNAKFSGGSGGGSGALLGGTNGVSGAGGTAAVAVMVAAPVLTNVALECKGGRGGDATLGDATGAGGGGGGGGGRIDVFSTVRSGVSTNVSAGSPGNGAGTGSAGGRGSDGSVQYWDEPNPSRSPFHFHADTSYGGDAFIFTGTSPCATLGDCITAANDILTSLITHYQNAVET